MATPHGSSSVMQQHWVYTRWQKQQQQTLRRHSPQKRHLQGQKRECNQQQQQQQHQ
jgi:hypothetical protein